MRIATATAAELRTFIVDNSTGYMDLSLLADADRDELIDWAHELAGELALCANAAAADDEYTGLSGYR